MEDPPGAPKPPSPISVLLQSLGMTREDLALHTEQMRAHLSQESPAESDPFVAPVARTLKRTRTSSLTQLFTKARESSPSPPHTPVKSEPRDVPVPPHQADPMEMVLDRKRKLGKRERRESVIHAKEGRRVSGTQKKTPTRVPSPKLPPGTPHHYKYYSERVIGEASTSQSTLSPRSGDQPPRTPKRQQDPFDSSSPYARPPKTPANRHIYSHASSSRASTPCSSPAPIVNIVSSPGPMPLDAEQDEPNDLPYTLPPGPYSKEKPDYSYAALIGQAIISSPEHRLTLQDIYEWITTVYPFYTRGEQTWMNSVRHSLSTMAVFRKVPRGRNEGKSLWAIWDADLPCFENGGFRKSLCADMVKAKAVPGKTGPKRKTMEETLARESKRRKKSNSKDAAGAGGTATALPSVFAPILPPYYAPVYPNPQQQPYYTSYIAHPIPAEVIFPPLPPQSAYQRTTVTSTTQADVKADAPPTSSPNKAETKVKVEDEQPSGPEDADTTHKESPMAPSSSSSSSIDSSSSIVFPGFRTICRSSSASSPPPSSEPSFDGTDGDATSESEPSGSTDVQVSAESEDEVDRLTRQWLASPSVIEAFAGPSPKVTPEGGGTQRKAHVSPLSHSQSQSYSTSTRQSTQPSFVDVCMSEPPSPTPNARPLRRQHSMHSFGPSAPTSLSAVTGGAPTSLSAVTGGALRLTMPSPGAPPPQTPPTRTRTISSSSIKLSAQKTPISHRGLHMSPSTSASLAHYKSNLDPPPPAVYRPPLVFSTANVEDPSLTLPSPELPKTPSRKRTALPGSGSGSGNKIGLSLMDPVTPRRLFSDESPDRAGVFDPHDPSTLLEEEVQRLGSQVESTETSPTGFFGKRSILYESPDMPNVARWERYW